MEEDLVKVNKTMLALVDAMEDICDFLSGPMKERVSQIWYPNITSLIFLLYLLDGARVLLKESPFLSDPQLFLMTIMTIFYDFVYVVFPSHFCSL